MRLMKKFKKTKSEKGRFAHVKSTPLVATQYSAEVVNKPNEENLFLSVIDPVPGCPPGLEFLLDIGHIFIKQTKEFTEEITYKNRYHIYDLRGNRLYFVGENCKKCSIFCMGRNRPFVIEIKNFEGRIVLKGERLCSYCLWFWGGSCTENTLLLSKDGENFGQITQNWNCCRANYRIEDTSKVLHFQIIGPSCSNCCTICLKQNTQMGLYDQGGQIIGVVAKDWRGFFQQFWTSEKVFGIIFPSNLNVAQKALILGSIFLIAFQYYEQRSSYGAFGYSGIYLILIFVFSIIFITLIITLHK